MSLPGIVAALLLLVTAACAQQQRIAYVTITRFDRDLFVSGLDKKDRKVLAQLAYFPSWSPDGSRLAYFGTPRASWNDWTNLNLLVYDFRTKKTKTLITLKNERAPQAAAWSPDGKQIAFSMVKTLDAFSGSGYAPREIGTGLVLVDTETGKLQPVQFSDGLSCVSDPNWSPDGKYLVLHDCSPDGRGLVIVQPDGKVVRRLTRPDTPNTFDRFPAWSPDGQQIAFVSTRGDTEKGDRDYPRRTSIFLVNVDGSGLRSLVTHNELSMAFPNWSSDGKLLAFEAIRPRLTLGNFAVKSEGTKALVLSLPDGQLRAAFEEGTAEPALAPTK